MPLSQLVDARLELQTTLVIPPAVPLQRDQAMLDRIAQLDLAAARADSEPHDQGNRNVECHPVS